MSGEPHELLAERKKMIDHIRFFDGFKGFDIIIFPDFVLGFDKLIREFFDIDGGPPFIDFIILGNEIFIVKSFANSFGKRVK
jgi:hypothetical protein